MGISAGMMTLLTTVGTAAVGAVISKVMAPKVDKPRTPEPVATIGDTEADKAAKNAQKKQREAAAAAVGRQDTILTGMGLGTAESTGNAAIKTLLGS